jgi:DNA-binding HxlR family transcriptional regulator
MKAHFNCPVQATINAISGKWKVQIVWHLSFGSMRFAQLQRKLKEVSEKVLTDQLRQLEADGIITRTVTPTRPPRTDYALSRRGELLIPTMQELCDWGSVQFGIQPSLRQPRGNRKSE